MARSVPLTCSGHTRPVVHLEFSELQEDGTYTLLSSCKDGNPMLRDWLGDWVGTFLGHKGAVWAARLSGGDAAKAVTGSADFSAKVWDTYSGTCLNTFSHNHIVRAVAINSSGSKVITGGHEKKMRLFDLSREGESNNNGGAGNPDYFLRDGSTAHDGNIKSVVWQRGGSEENNVVSAGEDKIVRWWDIRNLGQTAEMSFPDPITSMERAKCSLGEILTVTAGKDVYFIDANSREVLKRHTLALAPSSVSLHPRLNDRFIAGSVGDGWVRVHDFESGEVKDTLKGHHGPAHAVSYSPDGELAASGSEDGTIRLWQTFPGNKYGLWA